MFNIGIPEMILIGAAALLVFGPKKLPELAKSLGKGIRDFKKAVEGIGESDDSEDKVADKKEPHQIPEGTVSQQAASQKMTPEPTSLADEPAVQSPPPVAHKPIEQTT